MVSHRLWRESRLNRCLGMGLSLALLGALVAYAALPIAPLPCPDFSFDPNSPAVFGGSFAAGDVMTRGLDSTATVLHATALGLHSPFDDVDALSNSGFNVPPAQSFVLLFSVDRDTTGLALSADPNLAEQNVPYNVHDQALRGQAASDEFVALTLFTWSGPSAVQRDRPVLGNATSVRNNFDEGGTDFGAAPPTHSRDSVPGAQEDNVDALAQLERTGVRSQQVVNVYFSLTRDSPSLGWLSNGYPPSGANIFFSPLPGQSDPNVYASAADLGLVPGDDIDALVLFDPMGPGVRGVFDATDIVLFSLDPNSPSLNTIVSASVPGGAADVFVKRYGQPIEVFAPAALLGLGDPNDNIDALDIIPFAGDPVAFAAQHGIRAIPGDCNDDGVVNLADYACCMYGPDVFVVIPNEVCGAFDVTHDLDVDLADFAAFQCAWLSGF